jgi:hypothetical protein
VIEGQLEHFPQVVENGPARRRSGRFLCTADQQENQLNRKSVFQQAPQNGLPLVMGPLDFESILIFKKASTPAQKRLANLKFPEFSEHVLNVREVWGR